MSKKKKKKKGKTDFEKRLAKGQEAYEKSKKGLPTVPPGTYHLKLMEAEVVESKSSEKLQVRRVYQVMEGEHEGETVRDYLQLETEKAGFFTARWIENMGYEAPENKADIPEVVNAIAAEMPDFMGTITLSKGGFTNVRFVELLEGGEVVTDDVEEEEEEEEDEGEEEEEEGDDEDESDDEDEEEEEEEESDDEDEDEDEEEEEEEDEGDDEDEQLKSDLLAFCQAQELEVDEDADVETIKAAINQYNWGKESITKDEVKLIKSIGGKFAEPKKEKKAKAAKKGKKKAASKKKKGGKKKKK